MLVFGRKRGREMSAHVVSSIEAPDFGGMTLRVGDLNGDGAPDLLITQSDYGSREIRCLTAISITGAHLWPIALTKMDPPVLI
jgi:hypothetical protein